MQKDFKYFTDKNNKPIEKGPHRTEFLARLSTSRDLAKHFDGSSNCTQIKNLTPGKNYRIHGVDILDNNAGINFILFDDTGREQTIASWFFTEPGPNERLITMTAVRRDGYKCHTQPMTFIITSADENFNLQTAVQAACREYITQTRTGYENWAYNSFEFNWADFWSEVPNTICEKHGFRKLQDAARLPDVNMDECLCCEDDVTVTEDQKDAIINHLIANGVEACVDFLESLLSPNIPPFTDPEDFRDIIRTAMSDYADTLELLEFYMLNITQES